MNVVFIVPTGLGAEIGGHAGDACPAARLMSGVCDTLITHPNVVNASDINEMTPNMLYVEGSILDRFLEGKIELKRVRSNRILVVTNPPIREETINAVSAARAILGVEAQMVVLETPLQLIGRMEEGRATGDVYGWEELVEQVQKMDTQYDALAIASQIELAHDIAINYYRNGGVNPWGGVEAKASRLIAEGLNKPVAHAPVEYARYDSDPELYLLNEVVDPRIAAEALSMTYIHCVLKGLHKAPRIGKGLSVDDVDVLVSPYGCYGRPHRACAERGIPIIMVEENKLAVEVPGPFEGSILVKNYLEATGVVAAMKEGVSLESVRRPLGMTTVLS